MFWLTVGATSARWFATAPGKWADPSKQHRQSSRMLSLFRRLMKNNEGATVVEFTLIVSLIAVAAIASLRSVSDKVSNVLGNVAGTVI